MRERSPQRQATWGPSAATASAEQLLFDARAELVRLTPLDALRALRNGALLVDIRSESQRSEEGVIPGAVFVPRNVLEWRLDPRSPHSDPELARIDVPIVLICSEGFQSSLAAATVKRFGLDVTDVIGGAKAWRAQGLPMGADQVLH